MKCRPGLALAAALATGCAAAPSAGAGAPYGSPAYGYGYAPLEPGGAPSPYAYPGGYYGPTPYGQWAYPQGMPPQGAYSQGPYAQGPSSQEPYPQAPYPQDPYWQGGAPIAAPSTGSYPPRPAPGGPPPPAANPAPPAPEAGPTSGAAKAVAFALGKIGAPYCWGGTGPKCFDCSGLTHAAWLSGGKSIPRTSEQQASTLKPVSFDRIQPGDIAWRPGHVGIYVGRGLVVSATKTGDVVRAQPLSGYVKAVRP